ncbi:MAG TPA: PHB depolymerase family esterase [Ktedonobacteraceae bacterium]|jgi:polyhydroxybutyrate depolymerase|nr:PHB depolymerase family esterase [Ktedonobacteraceae bacterium]
MSNFHEERSHRLRRIIGLSGIIIALLLIVGAGLYSARAGILPVGGLSSKSPVATAGASPVAAACRDLPSHQPGNSSLSLQSAGLTRTFLVHLPPSYGSQPQPVVINYHGYDNTAQNAAQHTRMGNEADKAGFIVVFPQAVDSPPSWNAGIGTHGPTGDADDVQFTNDLIGYLEHNYCVDTHRIYVTGYSEGGGMAYRIACALSNQIAAFATVEGAFYHVPGGCNPSRAVPFLEIHGQADQLAPYNGNPYMGMASVQTILNLWLGIDQCQNSSTVIFQKADVTGYEWSHCASGTVVEHYRISDGGHTWPGSSPIPSLGYTTQTIDANVVIWNFFSRFSL